MRSLLILVMLAPVAWHSAAADENPVYESLGTVSIGRVFLNQQQRDSLDRLRLRGPETGTPTDGRTEAEVKDKAPAAAGFIIGPNGRSRTWTEGDFVDSTRARALSTRFPGDVPVERQAEQPEAENHEASD